MIEGAQRFEASVAPIRGRSISESGRHFRVVTLTCEDNDAATQEHKFHQPESPGVAGRCVMVIRDGGVRVFLPVWQALLTLDADSSEGPCCSADRMVSRAQISRMTNSSWPSTHTPGANRKRAPSRITHPTARTLTRGSCRSAYGKAPSG